MAWVWIKRTARNESRILEPKVTDTATHKKTHTHAFTHSLTRSLAHSLTYTHPHTFWSSRTTAGRTRRYDPSSEAGRGPAASEAEATGQTCSRAAEDYARGIIRGAGKQARRRRQNRREPHGRWLRRTEEGQLERVTGRKIAIQFGGVAASGMWDFIPQRKIAKIRNANREGTRQ